MLAARVVLGIVQIIVFPHLQSRLRGYRPREQIVMPHTGIAGRTESFTFMRIVGSGRGLPIVSFTRLCRALGRREADPMSTCAPRGRRTSIAQKRSQTAPAIWVESTACRTLLRA